MTYQEEQEAKTKALTELTTGLAKELGAPWKVIPNEERNYPTHKIENGDGAVLWVSIIWNHKDRANISGSLFLGRGNQHVTVYENNERAKVPDITVALARGPAAIAKDVQRRLLPEYLRILELAKAQVKRENETTAKRQANIRKLAAVTGDKVPDFERDPDTSRFWTHRGTLDIHYDGSVSLERFTMTIEEAEYILRYLHEKK